MDAVSKWIGRRAQARGREGMTDIDAVQRGFVSVTPLQTDTTDHGALSVLTRWDLTLGNGHGG